MKLHVTVWHHTSSVMFLLENKTVVFMSVRLDYLMVKSKQASVTAYSCKKYKVIYILGKKIKNMLFHVIFLYLTMLQYIHGFWHQCMVIL